jgi:hypothetical protein
MIRIKNNFWGMARDVAINQILISSGNIGIQLSQLLQYNPYDIALGLILTKLGVTNKIIIGVIIAFLL